MWLDNLKDLKKASGKTTKQIAEETGIPEGTVKRILEGRTDDPYVSTLHKIVIALGGSLDMVLSDTNAVLVPQKIAEIKETAQAVEAEKEIAAAENAILQDQVKALTAEVELLKLKLQHKDELLALHNFYNKMKVGE